MLISTKTNIHHLTQSCPYMQFQDTNIAVTSSEQLLGITVDNTLSWDIQVENVLKKCNTYLFLLSRIKQFLSIDSRTLSYNAYILPHLDYCCVVWGNCSRSLVEKRLRFQKRAGRLILNKDFDTPSTFLFSQLKWMTCPERVPE